MFCNETKRTEHGRIPDDIFKKPQDFFFNGREKVLNAFKDKDKGFKRCQ